MKDNCTKYRKENALLRNEMNRLCTERYEDKQMYENEITRLNDIIRELQSKTTTNHQLNSKSNNHHNQLNRIPTTNNKYLIKENHQNHDHLINNKLFVNDEQPKTNRANDSTKQLINLAMEDLLKRSNEKFRAEVNEKVEHVKHNFLLQLEQEIELIITKLTIQQNSKTKQQSNVLNELNINEQCTLKISPDIQLILKPLKKFIEFINCHFENKKLEILTKIDELENSQRLLENSLNRTRLADHEVQKEKLNELIEKINILERTNQQLKLAQTQSEKREDDLKEKNKELIEDNGKLIEDNTQWNYQVTQCDAKICEVEQELRLANKQIIELKQKNDLNFESKEQTILGKIKKDNEKLVKVLNNKFSEMLNELKDSIDTVFPNDKKKVYDQINKFLTKFHQFADEKIKENTALVENYSTRNISISYMEMPSTFGPG